MITDKVWNREYESKFNHRTWSEPVDYFCPVDLQLVNPVEVTPDQYAALLQLVHEQENGLVQSTELAARAQQIHPDLKLWRRNQIIIRWPPNIPRGGAITS